MIESCTARGCQSFTPHYMEEAERLCDRIAIVDHGCVIAEGTKEELVHDALPLVAKCWCALQEPPI